MAGLAEPIELMTHPRRRNTPEGIDEEVAFAVVTIAAVSASRGWTTTIDPTIVIAAPIIGFATGALAGALPALRAAKVPPVITLRG